MNGILDYVQELSFDWQSARKVFVLLWDWSLEWAKENPYVTGLGIWTALRAMGETVKSGNTGLFFSFGRVTRVLEPGFVFKIPFFQVVKTLPSRARTLDVPDQKVTSAEGLVWFVDVNLLYQVVDIRKALIEVDDLQQGMEQMLGLSVQEVVRAAERQSMRLSGGLDKLLEQKMATRLAPWGVEVRGVGFTSIRPSPQTLKFTQQQHSCEVRSKTLGQLTQAGIPTGHALAMLGTAQVPRRRAVLARSRESISRRKRRILRWVFLAEKAVEQGIPAKLRTELRKNATANLFPGK